MEQWSEEALRLETPSPCTDKTLPVLGAGAQLSRVCATSRALHALVGWPCQADRAALNLGASLLFPDLWPFPSQAQATESLQPSFFLSSQLWASLQKPSCLPRPFPSKALLHRHPLSLLPPTPLHTHTHTLTVQPQAQIILSPGRMKGSRLPGEGGDRQRQMGNPEKGPGLKMDGRCL